MLTHPNIRYLLIQPVVLELFISFTRNLTYIKLMEKGFDLDFLNEFEMYFFVLDLLVIFLIGRLNVLDNLWRIYKVSTDILFANCVLFWLMYYFVSKEGN